MPSRSVSTPTVLVTGGAVRIGRALALALARRGWGVVVHHNRSAAPAERLARHIRDSGGRAWTVRGPLDTEAECRRILDEAWTCAGGLDALVNNASVFRKMPLSDADAAEFESEWRVNFLAPALLTRAFVLRRRSTRPRRRAAGCVVNLLDRRIAGAGADCVPYWLSKRALADYTRAAALAFAPDVRVNGVAPGAILPPPGPRHARAWRDAAGFVPLAIRCGPADVAAAVVFLLESPALTGQIVFADGGQHLCDARPPPGPT